MKVTFRDKPWFQVLCIVLLFAVVFFVAAFLEALVSGMPASLSSLARVGVLFAALGALYGTSAALDSRSDFSDTDRPVWRTVLGSFFGGLAVYIVWSWYPENFEFEWILSGAVFGAVLGWYGWRWAKHVDF